MKTSLLVPDPQTNTTVLNANVASISNSIDNLELEINGLMFGTSNTTTDAAMDTWFNPATSSFVHIGQRSDVATSNSTFPDIIANLSSTLTKTNVNLQTNLNELQANIGRTVQAGTSVVNQIVGYVKSALGLAA
jgi:hypothetical protein